MHDRLISTRESVAWAVCLIILAAVLVGTGFTSTDPDSALYAGLAERLAQEPLSRWFAPEWWGFWPEAQMTGLFREHPAGVLLLPAALTVIPCRKAGGSNRMESACCPGGTTTPRST